MNSLPEGVYYNARQCEEKCKKCKNKMEWSRANRWPNLGKLVLRCSNKVCRSQVPFNTPKLS